MTPRPGQWTNPSVLSFAQGRDPLAVIVECARTLVLDALDSGWAGPPFDPIALANLLRIDVVAREDVPDARTLPVGGRLRIEFNPNRPPQRVRYSLAHEIAHTLFPDCAEAIRSRSKHAGLRADDWELEALCNIAAAEILMPTGELQTPQPYDCAIERVLQLREQYLVSTEAVLIRLTHLANFATAAFAASRIESGRFRNRYRLDYVVASRDWHHVLPRRRLIPTPSLLEDCTAIGFTAKGQEGWIGNAVFGLECVAIPPYPTCRYPRIVGFIKESREPTVRPRLTKVRGDALHPRGSDHRVIVQVVNDATPNWGGPGFAPAVAAHWPHVQDDFRRFSAQQTKGRPPLGTVHISQAEDEISVASCVAQKGYGPSTKPRIRYAALRSGLERVAELAIGLGASVHMPQIGCGQAGGKWELVQELIETTLCARDVSVTVYYLPSAMMDSAGEEDEQTSLRFSFPG